MLISSSVLSTALKRYNNKKEQDNKDKSKNIKKFKENYKFLNQFGRGASWGSELFFLIVAMALFIAELILLFYLFTGAIRCTKAGPERILHVLLIFFFTYPYALFVAFWGNNCTLNVLRGVDLNPNLEIESVEKSETVVEKDE